MDQPVIKLSIPSLDESRISREELFSTFSRNYQKLHDAETRTTREGGKDKLIIQFPNFEEFKNSFKRNLGLSQEFLNFSTRLENTAPHMEYKNPTPSDPEEDYVFLIIQIETTSPEQNRVIREAYNFSFRVASIFGFGLAFEEIENGFLVFYKYKEDYEFVQLDKKDVNRVLSWIQEHMKLTKEHQSFFQRFAKKVH